VQAPSFVRREAFERLRALLIEKYGAPTNDDATTERDHLLKTVIWALPTTTIALTWSESSRHQLGYVSLEYKAVDKKALDTLGRSKTCSTNELEARWCPSTRTTKASASGFSAETRSSPRN
jgi:hypothetical protein